MEHTSDPHSGRGNIINRIFGYIFGLKSGDGFLIKIAILTFFGFLVWYVIGLSGDSQVDVSSPGGSFTEGIIGTPRFVNPVLAVTRADRDMSILIYDGLMKLGPDGTLVPNIAEEVTVSEDGLTYNITLKQHVVFHDGAPLTAEDIVFTVGRIQDPALASPLRANFDGVSVELLGDHEINFVLPEAYAPFVENLTFGILPRHIWKDASNEEFPFSQHNSEPIGSGPYTVSKINRNTSGIPESFVLVPHSEYHNGAPNIAELILNFYASEEKVIEAFNAGLIDSVVGISESNIENISISENTHSIVRAPLPRTFALFFNQNKSAALRDEDVRRALDVAVDRDGLIAEVLKGYGQPLTSPIPPGFGVTLPQEEVSTTTSDRFEEARAILKDAGWKLNEETGIWEKEIDDILTPLAFSIATVNNSVFENTAEYIRREWEQLGASIAVKQFEQSDLTQSIIRPRDYEALLFGTAVGRSLDFFSFWHSSQRNDPGLNVALYANITTDSILSEIRTNSGSSTREASLLEFADEVALEVPAVFLYSPELIYIFPNQVTNANFTGLEEPSERFTSIQHWSMHTESVWPLFRNETNE